MIGGCACICAKRSPAAKLLARYFFDPGLVVTFMQGVAFTG